MVDQTTYQSEFRLGIFGVEVEEKVFNLVKQFTNDKGHWTSDPRLAIHRKNTE